MVRACVCVCVCVYMRVCVWLCVCVSVVVVVAVAVVVVDTNACIEYGCSCLCRTKDKHASSIPFKVWPCFQLCHGPHHCYSNEYVLKLLQRICIEYGRHVVAVAVVVVDTKVEEGRRR